MLGVKKEKIIRRFIDHMPVRFEYDPEDCGINGVMVEIDANSGKTTKLTPIII